MTPELSDLVERIERLEAELEHEREERQRLEEELDQEREARQRLEERLDEREELIEARPPEDAEAPSLNDVWVAGNPVGKILERVQTRSRENAERLEQGGAESEPEPAEENDPAAPPVWDLVRTPESNLEPTERRARFLWKDLNDYATSAPVGLVLPASDARRVLEAAEPDESDADKITSKQVGRAFHLLQSLTREAVEIREGDGERQLVVPRDWEEQARAAAPDGAVS